MSHPDDRRLPGAEGPHQANGSPRSRASRACLAATGARPTRSSFRRTTGSFIDPSNEPIGIVKQPFQCFGSVEILDFSAAGASESSRSGRSLTMGVAVRGWSSRHADEAHEQRGDRERQRDHERREQREGMQKMHSTKAPSAFPRQPPRRRRGTSSSGLLSSHPSQPCFQKTPPAKMIPATIAEGRAHRRAASPRPRRPARAAGPTRGARPTHRASRRSIDRDNRLRMRCVKPRVRRSSISAWLSMSPIDPRA